MRAAGTNVHEDTVAPATAVGVDVLLMSLQAVARMAGSYKDTHVAPAALERTAASTNATPSSPSAPVG